MKIKNGALALAGSFDPKKITQLFYVTHNKLSKPVLGPFLSHADAECGLIVIRSKDTAVMAESVKACDHWTYWRAANNGRICRLFAVKEFKL
ncbi:hypothetical protein P4A93_03565 [Pseudomonas syringae pv. syringae]|uniref:hypothetical protein n=1 Tax=Pseudomonas syringae TaxID=317 RepID=UPI0023F8C5EF|nr:hypothetical protein [Pseudomonas syringae]MDF5890708.1 hypothetical protein [Pseudomonas syringae pv. syringae]